MRYIARKRAGERRKRTRVILLHDLRTEVPDLTMVEGELVENARYLPARRNGVALYHEILSLSREDASKLMPAMLQDLAKRYLDLRAPRSLAYGEAHWATGTPHVHLMISGNEVESGKKTRLSKTELEGRIRQLEEIGSRQSDIRQGKGTGIIDEIDKSEQDVDTALDRIMNLQDAEEASKSPETKDPETNQDEKKK